MKEPDELDYTYVTAWLPAINRNLAFLYQEAATINRHTAAQESVRVVCRRQNGIHEAALKNNPVRRQRLETMAMKRERAWLDAARSSVPAALQLQLAACKETKQRGPFRIEVSVRRENDGESTG